MQGPKEDDGSNLIPSSIRADGSVRKAIRVKPGFVPTEERQKYVPPQKRAIKKVEGETILVTRPYYGKFPSQMTEDELSAWLEAKAWLRPYHS